MTEPKLLTLAELAAIRARAVKDGPKQRTNYATAAMVDRAALLSHIDAKKRSARFFRICRGLKDSQTRPDMPLPL